MTWRGVERGDAGSPDVENLKLCDLCGALNLSANRECFVCSWHGSFTRNPSTVGAAVDVLRRRHGSLPALSPTGPSRRAPNRLLRVVKSAVNWLFGSPEHHARPGVE